jgi:hypothetical protein
MLGNWKTLENHVRGIAELRWHAPCRPEHINGVDFDGVVHISDDEIVLIEITTERTLEKVRSDINKIAPTKLQLATEGIICRGFVVLKDEPTNSMAESGQSAHISVVSEAAFERAFYDYRSYDVLRAKLPFGSAVDSKTGENDPRTFVPVCYSHSRGQLSIEDIVTRLLRGNRVVLTGDFGTGKSRCVREVYNSLSGRILDAGAFPLAVNLRDHWSSSNALGKL